MNLQQRLRDLSPARHELLRRRLLALAPDADSGVDSTADSTRMSDGDPRIVAYLVGRPEELPNATALRDFLREYLPSHMIPSDFVAVDRLPRLANGKIDSRAFPLLDEHHLPTHIGYVEPNTDLHRALDHIWREILGLGRVGIHDDFFEIGGDSLLVTQLVSRIREKLGAQVVIRDIFDHPTIETLSNHIDALKVAGTDVQDDDGREDFTL